MKIHLIIVSIIALMLAAPAINLLAENFKHPASFRAISNGELREFVDHLQSTSNDFDDDFADALDDSSLDGTDEEDRMANQAEALEDTFDKMKKALKKDASDAEIRDLAARGTHSERDQTRWANNKRCSPRRLSARQRASDAASRWDLRHGCFCRRRRIPAPARPWRRRVTRRRRFDHADRSRWQHQRARHHGCREGC